MANKYGYNGAGGNNLGGGGGGMQNLLKQAQQMQQKLAEAQEELDNKSVCGSAGGGMVEITCTGKKVITAVKIDSKVVDPEDVEMLEDLIVAAINDAYAKSQAVEDELMEPFAAMKGLM